MTVRVPASLPVPRDALPRHQRRSVGPAPSLLSSRRCAGACVPQRTRRVPTPRRSRMPTRGVGARERATRRSLDRTPDEESFPAR